MLLLTLCGVITHLAHAQVRVGPSSVVRSSVVRPQVSESVTLSVSPTSASFTLVPGGNSAAVAYTVHASWSLTQTRSISLYAYFSSSSSALTGSSSSVNIPSSAVFSTTAGSSAYTAFTGSNPFNSGNSSVTLVSNYSISGSSSANVSLNLRINCSSLPQLPADSYTGVLYIQAQAI